MKELNLSLKQLRYFLVASQHSSLRKADAWIRRFFANAQPGDNARAQRFLDNLASLQQVKVDPELPDISVSLRQLKTLVDSLYESGAVSKPANASGATPQQPAPGNQDEGAE